MTEIYVVGAGLAGCEAAWSVASAGLPVTVFEMKPEKRSPAHRSDGFAELVCSNSLKASRLETSAGLLKEEMRRLGSLTVPCAEATAVDAGGALAVDRNEFSALVTRRIRENPLITVESREITELSPKDGEIWIVATGPLTSEPLAEHLRGRFGGGLSFFDAAAPVVTAASIDMDKVFFASRYGRGGDDYLNCPMNREQYEAFWNELVNAERAQLEEFDRESFRVYEGCMPVEVMAARGIDTLRYGPLKPKGLTDPHTGHRPWANLQLRREDAGATMFNLVGFQTNLKFGEQKRVFGMIPGLENAEFVRYGVMHRNTFMKSPELLDADFSLRSDRRIYFAGQMTGVEGYMESAASGILAGINAARAAKGLLPLVPGADTMTGALARYISEAETRDFQPMGAAMGLLPELPERIRDKKARYAAYSARALASLDATLRELKAD